MRIRITVIALLAGLGLAFATASPASAEDAKVTIHKSDGVNGPEIASAIATIPGGGRGEFVEQAVQEAFDRDGGDYNVVMHNLSQGYEENLEGVKLYANVRYGEVNYGLWIAEGGEFTNTGDGGYINWAFRGWFDRDDNTVRFHQP
ncbi:hypothetical protein ACHAAC_09255 [Aeromicrobium sp. CF4.19]|uniref:hypothetical protein n=1 Tax=Aeromicrobium sp. CF4.19 TaxID=3373082 RepID=UPI003EE451F6